MDCRELILTGHALRQMAERHISVDDVQSVIATGEPIMQYPDDRPHPSQLLFATVSGRPLHVVAAYDQVAGKCFLITAYEPDPAIWNDDFRTRRNP